MTLKPYITDLGVHEEVRTGCRLWGLRPSRLRKNSSEGAEEIEVGRSFHSETVGAGTRNERGQGVGSVPGTVVMFPWS